MCCGGRKPVAIGIGRVNFAGAAPFRGEVRIHKCGRCAGGFFAGDARLAGAARGGEVRFDGCSWHKWWWRAGLLNFFVNDEGKQDFKTYIYPNFVKMRADHLGIQDFVIPWIRFL